MRKNNTIFRISLLLVTLILSGCIYGNIDSDDPKTVLYQGHGLEKVGRMVPANERYMKGLHLAEQQNDKRMIAFAKYYIGLFYRNPSQYSSFKEANSYGYIDKSIKYLKESLEFYANDDNGYPPVIASDMYTALTEVYDKKGDKKSACLYLGKLNYTYKNKLLTNDKYNPKNFYNATGKKFSNLGKLIEYYNQKIGCGI